MPKPWQDALLGRQHDRSPGNVGCKGDGMAEALGRPRRSGEKNFLKFFCPIWHFYEVKVAKICLVRYGQISFIKGSGRYVG